MKPEKYPKLIQIEENDWHVTFATRLTNGDLGFADSDMKLIAISRDQDEKSMLETFIHEVLHCAEFECGFTLGHPKIRKLERILASVFLQLQKAQKEVE